MKIKLNNILVIILKTKFNVMQSYFKILLFLHQKKLQMRKIILLCLVLAGIHQTNAQFVEFGIKGGLNFTNYRDGNLSNFEFETATNYHFGAVAEFSLLSNLNIQTELLYSTQGAQFERAGFDVKNELGYISIPVLAKVYINNENLSLEVGPQFSFLATERNKVGTKDTETYDFGLIGGLGLKLTDTFFIQARYVLGLSDVKPNADIKNSAIQVSLGMMF